MILPGGVLVKRLLSFEGNLLVVFGCGVCVFEDIRENP